MRILCTLKKGVTLIELVVAIAISTVIFVGASGIMLYLNTANSSIKNDTSNFYCANTLCHAVENELDLNNGYLSNLPDETIELNDPIIRKVEEVDTLAKEIFTVKNTDEIVKHYYFIGQHFGYTTNDSSAFNEIYFTNADIKFIFAPTEDSDLFKLSFKYNKDYVGEIKLLKTLNESN